MADISLMNVGNAGSFPAVRDITVNVSSAGKGGTDFWKMLSETAKDNGNPEKANTDVSFGGMKSDRKPEKVGPREETSGKKDEKVTSDSESREIDGEENITDEEWEAAATLVSGAVQTLIGQISEIFDMDIEDINEAVNAMGFSETDLLDPNKLGELLNGLNDVADSIELVTNEDLLKDYRAVMDEAAKALSKVSEKTGISKEKILAGINSEVNQNEDEAQEDLSLSSLDEGDTKAVKMPKIIVNTESSPKEGFKENDTAKTDRTVKGVENDNSHLFGPHMNLNKMVEVEQALTSRISEAASDIPGFDAEFVMNQIMDDLKFTLKEDSTDITMNLHPASLGNVRVMISSANGVMSANFYAQNENVRAALESQLVTLKETFAEQNIKVDNVEVFVQTKDFNSEPGNGGAGDRQGFDRQKTRKLRIDPLLGLVGEDELSNEDVLAAKIMEANGNTIDFIA